MRSTLRTRGGCVVGARSIFACRSLSRAVAHSVAALVLVACGSKDAATSAQVADESARAEAGVSTYTSDDSTARDGIASRSGGETNADGAAPTTNDERPNSDGTASDPDGSSAPHTESLATSESAPSDGSGAPAGSTDGSSTEAAANTGGNTAGDTGDDPDAPTIPLIDPNDCELTPLDAPMSEDQCIVQARCGERQGGVNCTDVGFGTWQCNCMELSTVTSFELTNVDIDTACRAGAPLCTWGVHPSQVEPPECEAATQSTTNYPCERSMHCTQQVHVTDTVIATLSDDLYSRCITDPEGGFECNCRSASRAYVYDVAGSDAAAGCEAGTQLCDPYDPVDLGEASCQVNTETLRADECVWRHDCTYAVTLPAASVEVEDSPFAGCRQEEGIDTPFCECGVLNRRLAFTFAEPNLSLTTCTDAVALCASNAEAVPTADTTCVETSRYDAEDMCSYRANCTQTGTIADHAIVARRQLWSDCTELPLEPGTWRCSCDLGHATAMTEFSGPPSPDICLTFAENCTNVNLFEQIDE